MDIPFGLIMLIGKYLFLGLVYGFLYWAFRGLFDQTALEAKSPRPAAAPRPLAVPAPVLPAPVPAAAVTVEAPTPAPAPEPPPVIETFAAPVQPLAPAQPVIKPALLVDDAGQSSLSAGQVIELTAAVTIGRAEDNGIVIADKFCSTHHAMIFLQAGQRLLRDRNSTNGTFHNGRRLTEDVILQDGDRLGMGTVVFTYRAGSV